MLKGARKIQWCLRRQHLNLSYTPSIKLNFRYLSQPKVDESNDFSPWLERRRFQLGNRRTEPLLQKGILLAF
ncbi:hypothetical protein ACFX11_001226 [Malus domestica]